MTIAQRTSLQAIPAYKQGATPGEHEQAFKLSSNENPFPPLAAVTTALAAELGSINEYPNAAAPELVGMLAERFGVDPGTIALGAGSVEVAGQLIHATTNPGDEVMFAWRSFEAYPILTHVAGATPVMVPLDAAGAHDLEAMAAAITERTALVFICNPNNPTGTVVDSAAVDAFMAKVPARVLVVIDEAYVHFNVHGESAIGLDFFRRYPNVAVLHTFSKAYGLAGLRIGYAIAPARRGREPAQDRRPVRRDGPGPARSGAEPGKRTRAAGAHRRADRGAHQAGCRPPRGGRGAGGFARELHLAQHR